MSDNLFFSSFETKNITLNYEMTKKVYRIESEVKTLALTEFI